VTLGMVEAVRYYRLAAEQGDADWQCGLGYCYQHGTGVTLDMVEAVRYYRLAAEEGFARAQFQLGRCYQQGEGVALDLAAAVRYYRLAAACDRIAGSDKLISGELAKVLLACDRIAGSREVASTCCLGCGARRKLKTCTRCKVAKFCGAECVARAWPLHKPNCTLWRDAHDVQTANTDQL
jgi:hypothetical protein